MHVPPVQWLLLDPRWYLGLVMGHFISHNVASPIGALWLLTCAFPLENSDHVPAAPATVVVVVVVVLWLIVGVNLQTQLR